MGACPVLSVGAPGGVPDVTLINAALATIRAILNGDIDAANLENASVTLAKLAAGIGVVVPIVLVAESPGYDHASNTYSFNAGIVYSGYLHDARAFYAETAMTIVNVQGRFLGTPVLAGLKAKLYIDSVDGDAATGAQAATEIVPNSIYGNPVEISGLNISVAAGQKLSLRLDGVVDMADIPFEYTVFAKIVLS